MNYQKALEFAIEKHRGQLRKGGEDYVIHPIAVAEMLKKRGYDEEYQLTGLFHDLLEDTDAGENEILLLSNENVLLAVKMLTKYKNYVMTEYISNIKNNRIARVVKLADRLHNLSCAGDADENFVKKYLAETKNYFIDLAIGTEFEEDILQCIRQLTLKKE